MNSITDIANRLNEDREAVKYAVQTAGVEPAARVGNVRLFDDAGVLVVRQRLDAIREHPVGAAARRRHGGR